VNQRKGKIRAELRKNRKFLTRERGLTRRLDAEELEEAGYPREERISGKGELTRKRTIVGDLSPHDDSGLPVLPEVDRSACRQGRVLAVFGLSCVVRTDDGGEVRCITRGLLRTLSTEQRHVVAAGDHVWFRPEGNGEGVIEQIQPRHGVLSRASRGRKHVLVANIDQVVIVASAAEPQLKPNLIDRMLVTAEKSHITPLVCINKMDLVDPVHLQPLVGVLSQLGYRVLLVSAKTGVGIEHLRQAMKDRESVITGQSGVGKSSLLNAMDPHLGLKVQQVSEETQKGRHTTTTARLLPLSGGGYVVDTPGIRQFQLWDITAEELAGYFPEMRPYVCYCRFPDCTHIHEADCAVKDAVADGHMDARRYESYLQLYESCTSP
jgi:ribosome biogenesis GTPase